MVLGVHPPEGSDHSPLAGRVATGDGLGCFIQEIGRPCKRPPGSLCVACLQAFVSLLHLFAHFRAGILQGLPDLLELIRYDRQTRCIKRGFGRIGQVPQGGSSPLVIPNLQSVGKVTHSTSKVADGCGRARQGLFRGSDVFGFQAFRGLKQLIGQHGIDPFKLIGGLLDSSAHSLKIARLELTGRRRSQLLVDGHHLKQFIFLV